MHTYEAMFLLDAGQGDFEATCAPIHRVLERAGAEVLAMKLWDERRLAYEITGRRRATYVLVYMKVDPANVAELENDCKLAEDILRVLILRKEEITEEELAAETPATSPQETDDRDRDRGRGRSRSDRDDRRSSDDKGSPAKSEAKSDQDEGGKESGSDCESDSADGGEDSEDKDDKQEPDDHSDKDPDQDA
jgi:small subunit ribosomal protein S6